MITEEEKKAIEYWEYIRDTQIYDGYKGQVYAVEVNLITKLQEENKKYKRLAEANLKDSEEFKDNMCNHRCIKNNEILELQEENKKKDKVIEEMLEVLTDFEFDNKCQECTYECERDYDQLFQCNKEYFYRKVKKDI